MKKALKPLALVCLLTIGMISSSDARRITADPTPTVTCVTTSVFIDIFFGWGIGISVSDCD